MGSDTDSDHDTGFMSVNRLARDKMEKNGDNERVVAPRSQSLSWWGKRAGRYQTGLVDLPQGWVGYF